MKYRDYFEKESEIENIPQWINNFEINKKIDINEILNSHVLYYAGAGSDGDPMRIFNISHSVHIFIYADYGFNVTNRENMLTQKDAIKGYHLVGIKRLKEDELFPNGFVSHYKYKESEKDFIKCFSSGMGEPFALVSVYERDDEFDESHGAKRFALIYIGSDAVATYDALFINNNKPPFVFFLRDHGFGGNWSRFGRGGVLEKLIFKYHCFPRYISSDQVHNIYEGYSRIPLEYIPFTLCPKFPYPISEVCLFKNIGEENGRK